jgi:hypothetical protein
MVRKANKENPRAVSVWRVHGQPLLCPTDIRNMQHKPVEIIQGEYHCSSFWFAESTLNDSSPLSMLACKCCSRLWQMNLTHRLLQYLHCCD